MSIQVGSKVKVVSGGRYLGKEGKVVSTFLLGLKCTVEGSFPRSANKTRQVFSSGDLKVIETPLQKAKSELAEVSAEIEKEFKELPPVQRKIEQVITKAPAPDGGPLPFPLAVPPTNGPASSALGSRLAARVQDFAPHLVIKALAGTGKSTSMLQGVRRIKNDWNCKCKGLAGVDSFGNPKCRWCINGSGVVKKLEPTAQQLAIWEEMALSPSASSICMVAFNKPIAKELEERVPEGVKASTMHSLGFSSVVRAYGRVAVNEYRVQNIICELVGRFPNDPRRSQDDLWKNNRYLLKATDDLVALCKMNMVELTDDVEENREKIAEIASYYEVDTGNANKLEVYDLVPRVIERCLDVRKDMSVDYNDQVWLPAVQEIATVQYDVLIADESQDFNRCQQVLARKHGKRIIMVGDRNQSIYAWAGADAVSMDRMQEELSASPRGCNVLPLTKTRRCGKAIVAECQKVVPEFEAFETNPEGEVRKALYPSKDVPVAKSFMAEVRDGDLILCRCNAPLVNTCFRFLKEGRKATIQGRNIGQGLISTVKKSKAASVEELTGFLDDWRNSETAKENAKQNPSENKLINIQDRYDCLTMSMQDQRTVEDVIRRIESVFTDNKNNPGVKLSSIHRAKGTESDRVFILQLKGASVPHPLARSDWAKEGERCCLYVAQSRAIHTLVYVYDSV